MFVKDHFPLFMVAIF